MTVYVDDMRAPFGRYIMCHLMADTDEELHAMAERIGVARKWWQSPPKSSYSHYDIALSKRALAVSAGAVEVTVRQMACMAVRRRVTGSMGAPEEARAWHAEQRGYTSLVVSPSAAGSDVPTPLTQPSLTAMLF